MLAGQLDVVEHREQRLDDAADGHVAADPAVTVDPPLVVDVLGLQALQVAEPLDGQGGVRVDAPPRRAPRRPRRAAGAAGSPEACPLPLAAGAAE